MNKLATAITVIALIGTPAFAADMAVKMPVKAPPISVPPPCIWCGFYVGLNAGYGWSGSTSVNSIATVESVAVFLLPAVAAAAAAAATSPIPVGNRDGFIGGGQIGYNFQAGQFVGGVETDMQWLSGRGTGTVATAVVPSGFPPGEFVNATLTASNQVDWLGTLRGRIGLAVAPNYLLYGTGGLAYGGVSSRTSISENIGGIGTNGVFPALGSLSQTRTGWAAGAGAEWMFIGNWSAKLEYLHYDLGSASYGTPVNNFSVPPVLAGVPLYTLGQTSSTSFRGDIVRAGLNYQFH
jgi:outer membrane immunogenic protein